MSIENNEFDGGPMTPRLIVGAAIALFGLVLVLDRLNIVVADQALRLWPVVIIAVGAMIFTQARRAGGGINGIIVMAVGAWLLLNTVGILRVRFWDMFWPLVLIGIGATLVMQGMQRRTRQARGGNPDNTLTVFAVLSGVKRTSTADHFRGGEVTAFMGGAFVDLRQATIPPGEEAVLDIFAVMGGCEIAVPQTWRVATPIVPIMGGIDDKRLPVLPGAADSLGGQPAPRLVIRGLLIMGGVEIKS